MTEKTKDKVNEFLKILEIKFSDLFAQFEQKVKKLFEIVESIVKAMGNLAGQGPAAN